MLSLSAMSRSNIVRPSALTMAYDRAMASSHVPAHIANPILAMPPMVEQGVSGPYWLPTLPQPTPNPYFAGPSCDETVVCVVCGNICRPTTGSSVHTNGPRLNPHWTHPILIKAKPGFKQWSKDPSMSRAFERDDTHLFDFVEVEQFIGGSDGFHNRTRGRMTINTLHDEMYLPLHPSCLFLALKFCQYQSKFDINFRDVSIVRDSGEPSSLAHLYEIWMKRAWMTDAPQRGLVSKPIMEPFNYRGAYVSRRLHHFIAAQKGEAWGNVIQVQESDPLTEPTWTARVVMKAAVKINKAVVEEGPQDPELMELQARMIAAPPEIRGLIEEAMEPFNDLSLTQVYCCTRVYPPEWWMQKLVSGDLIPWLYDLTMDNVKSALNSPDGPGMRIDQVDWEFLCRQLAQTNPFDRDTGILRCPRLENRHRIWCLLSGSRLGHTLARGYSAYL